MSAALPVHPESVFTYGAPQLKFGSGASDEIGFDLSLLGVRRVLVITDPGVAATGTPQRVADQMAAFGIEARVYDGVRVEPTDVSLEQAIADARGSGPWDAYVAVGGGSAIDTAKAVALLTSNPGELMDYVNQPVGKGRAPASPLKPLVAVPTTTGTGSESTTICVMDVLSLKVKTGISHARLRPTLAVVDPDLTFTQPSQVTAASGMDILCHALESYTARWYTSNERKTPEQRVPYCGSNPISDMWAEKAMSLLAGSFRTAVRHGDDAQARADMALAATFAGMGFGNAGVHIPHANAYPIAGQVKDFRPAGYPAGEPMVPHGMSVSLTAPEAFRFTFTASPERHVRAARLLAPGDDRPADGELLPRVLTDLMRDIDLPNGIAAVGFDDGDVDDLVDGHAEAAAAARHLPARGHGRGRRGHLPPVDGALVARGARRPPAR
jgi:alcohol dehydrogenase class IV